MRMKKSAVYSLFENTNAGDEAVGHFHRLGMYIMQRAVIPKNYSL